MSIDEKCDFILIALYELHISGKRGMINAMQTLIDHGIEFQFNEHLILKKKLDSSGYAVTQIQGTNEFRAQITSKGVFFYQNNSFSTPGTSIEELRKNTK